jgi:hypothetical protein
MTTASGMSDVGDPVQLYVYDLSNGLARAMSMMLLGRQASPLAAGTAAAPPAASSCLQWHSQKAWCKLVRL